MEPAAIVINSSLARDPGRFRRRCREAAVAGGWEPSFLPTSLDDRGVGLARAAVAAGARMIVAAGGDGTVRACAQALAGSQVPLAIVPRGTANLVATALGIPSPLDAALTVGFGPQERRIDLAVADSVTFAAMAGIGLDAAVVGATAAGLKGAAGWLGYAAAGVRRLAGARTHFEIRLDGGEPLGRLARCVVVGNVGLLPGGFVLLPEARPDDGLLDVGILAPAGLFGWSRVAWRVLSRSRYDDAVLERYQARRVEIAAGAQLPRQADGELIGTAASLTVALAPGGLLVRVPAARRRGPRGVVLRRCEDNVSFGVRDRGSGGDVPYGTCRRAAEVYGLGAAFGGDEQVAGPDSGPRQLCRGQLQDGVVAWMLVAGREAIGKVGGGGSRRHQPGGFHADVAAGRQGRLRQRDDLAGRVHGVHPAAGLIRGDEVAAEPAEGRRRHGDPSLDGRPARRDGGQPAVAADAEHRGPAAGPGGDQQPVPEPPGAVEHDPG